jgi:hypothetical protein
MITCKNCGEEIIEMIRTRGLQKTTIWKHKNKKIFCNKEPLFSKKAEPQQEEKE